MHKDFIFYLIDYHKSLQDPKWSVTYAQQICAFVTFLLLTVGTWKVQYLSGLRWHKIPTVFHEK
jgi:hypothetical protein